MHFWQGSPLPAKYRRAIQYTGSVLDISKMVKTTKQTYGKQGIFYECQLTINFLYYFPVRFISKYLLFEPSALYFHIPLKMFWLFVIYTFIFGMIYITITNTVVIAVITTPKPFTNQMYHWYEWKELMCNPFNSEIRYYIVVTIHKLTDITIT